jgi:uncharacterized protein YecT (DUF1311 family)
MEFWMFKSSLWVALLAFVVFWCPEAQAQKKAANPYDKAVSQIELNACSAEQYRKADERLNALYASLMNSLRSGAQQGSDDERKYQEIAIQKLTAAEKEWIKYRDLHCDAVKQQFEGGSIAPMMWSSCMEQVTNDRILEITNGYEAGDRKIE